MKPKNIATTVSVRKGRQLAKEPLSAIPALFAECAVLSANIYDNSLNDKTAAAVKANVPPATLPVTGGWEIWRKSDLPATPPKPPKRRFIKGMGYELWEKKTGDATTIAIVFRGTDFNQAGDWYSNLRWLILIFLGRRFLERYFFDQYHQVQRLTPLIVAAIEKRYGHIDKIIATGHSLGGGLAQQAAYCCPHIKEVIAFDPSPVTGYMDVKKEERLINAKGIAIARIYQQGEVLSYLRSLLRRFYALSTENPAITEYEVNFIKGNLIARHSIKGLAENLTRILSKTDAVKHSSSV